MPAVLAPDRVNTADVLVVEPCGRLGLIAETLEHLLVVGLSSGEHLHGDGAVERGVERTEDRPHAPAPNELVEPVGAQHRALEHATNFTRRGRSSGDWTGGRATP